MKKSNYENARKLIDEMLVRNYNEMNELFVEFVDHVENDEHIVYQLKQLRDMRDDIIRLENIIEDDTQ